MLSSKQLNQLRSNTACQLSNYFCSEFFQVTWGCWRRYSFRPTQTVSWLDVYDTTCKIATENCSKISIAIWSKLFVISHCNSKTITSLCNFFVIDDLDLNFAKKSIFCKNYTTKENKKKCKFWLNAIGSDPRSRSHVISLTFILGWHP